MKPYKGIFRIQCMQKKGCINNLKINVKPECIECPKTLIEILGLNGRVLHKYIPAKKVKAVKRKRKTKEK